MTDALGNVIVGEEWFYNENFFEPIFHTGKKLYARWKPTKEVPKYKILMIYVTEIEADLESTDGEIIPVHYKMTENEKKMCEINSTPSQGHNKKKMYYLIGLFNPLGDS